MTKKLISYDDSDNSLPDAVKALLDAAYAPAGSTGSGGGGAPTGPAGGGLTGTYPNPGVKAQPWSSITGKPSTFAPIIGSGPTQAVAGNDPRLAGGGATAVQYAQQATNGAWPARPTSSSSVLVFWRGASGGSAPPEVTSGTGGMLRGVDVWVRVP